MAEPKIPQDTIDAICQMREAGRSYRQIAMRFGFSPGAVAWICLRDGAEPPNPRPLTQTAPGKPVMQRGGHVVRRFTPQEDAQILQMEADGARMCDIAAALNRRQNSIRGRLMTLARQEARRELAGMAAE